MLRRYYGKISKLPIDQFIGHDGELVVDDLTGRTYVMDGITLGGPGVDLYACGYAIYIATSNTNTFTPDGAMTTAQMQAEWAAFHTRFRY